MKKTLFTLGTALLFGTGVFAQNLAELDLSFDADYNANGAGESLTLQPDGKIIVTGHFTSKIVRLNADGSKDLSFNQPADWGAILKDAALLPDGKVIIVGNFTDYDGVAVNHIVRLNSDGTVDNTFDQGTGANNYLNAIALQPDGKLIITGVFTEYNGTARGGIARINADGTLDNTFDPGTGLAGISAEGEYLTFQSDGKILLAGKFTSYNGNPANLFVRINTDGSFDPSFVVPSLSGGNPAERRIVCVAVQSDGKIVVGGHFTSITGVARNGIARLNTDGTVDTSFDPGSGINITYGTLVASVYVLPNGKILAGGKFNTFDGVSRKGIAGLHAGGSLDTAFDPGTGVVDFLPYAMVNNFKVQANGKILIGGDFDEYNGVTRRNIARLNGDGGTTSVENIKDNFSFNIFPNPANDFVTITHLPSGSKLKVMDITGKTVYNSVVQSEQTVINTSDFVNGVYIIQIENNGSISNKKLIIN